MIEEIEPLAKLDLLVADHAEDTSEYYRIGDLAREFDVTLRTLRFYEDRGLINPRRDGSTRLYSRRDRARLKLILLAKQVGFSLVEIQEIMGIYDNGCRIEAPLKLIAEKFSGQMNVLVDQKQEIDQAIAKLSSTLNKLNEIAAPDS
jgi:DNA-binding transcriptional MerR regulator